MHRTSLMIAATAALALVVAACGSDGASTYEATRPGADDVRTVPTRPIETTRPVDTVVVPTIAPGTTTVGSTTAPSGEIVVRDTWFADDGFGGYDWGVVYENTSGTSYEYVDVDAEFLDASGNLLTSSDTSIRLVTPGAGALAYYTYDLDEAPASMQVTISGGDTSDFRVEGSITPGSLTVAADSSSVTGLLTSTYPADQQSASVTAVWRDGSGAVTRIDQDYVSTIQADGDTWFALYLDDPAIGVPAEVYVGLSPAGFPLTPPSAELTLRESWNIDVGDGSFNWGAIIDNGGSTTWSSLIVRVKFFDADDRLVTADSAYSGDVASGASAVSGVLYGLATTPTRMEATIADGGYETDPPTGALSIDQVAITQGSSSATITGRVSSTFADEQSYAELILVWRDAANAVVYSTSTYSDEILAGGSSTFTTTIYGDDLPTVVPTEVYWSV